MKQKTLIFLVLFLISIGNWVYAQTLPPGVLVPDNIIDACSIDPPAQEWKIEEITISDEPLSTFQSPVIADLDGDGIPEIIACDPLFQEIIIFNGKNLSKVDRRIAAADLNYIGTALGVARIQMNNGSYETLLFFAQEKKLSAYNYRTSGILWSITTPYTRKDLAPFGFVDFNGDGFVEIHIGNTIIDAATGNTLWQGTGKSGLNKVATGHISYLTAVGDVLNNGGTQLIIANQVYNVAINRTTFTATLTLEKELNLSSFTMEDGSAPFSDGNTALVDLNLDGNLDVVVVNTPLVTGGTMQFYVWTPATNTVLVKRSIPQVAKNGLPLIGDIDGDKYSELVFISGYLEGDVSDSKDYIRAFKYKPATNKLDEVWKLSHTDSGAYTGLTLFDFNQDGIMEIVYRDQTDLRIINGSGIHHITGLPVATPYDLAKIECTSGTRAELPIVADIDNDGHAEIITVGPIGVNRPSKGPLRIFKGPEATPWAWARPLWNQYAYNTVYVNQDLTIPKRHMNPATRFPGKDGILNNIDDVYPFNNLFQQQTTLDRNGNPLWLAPRADIIGTPGFSYDEAADKMTITVTVKNTGDAPFADPFFVTVYKDVAGGSPKKTYTYNSVLDIGDQVTISFDIDNFFATWCPYNFLLLRLNDNGNGLNHQEVCSDQYASYRYYGIIPTKQDVCLGKAVTISCSFVLPGGTNSYQWQSSPNDISWTDIEGATSNTYSPPDGKRSRTYYRVVVNDGAETIYSISSFLRVRSCKVPVNHNISVMEY